MWPLPGTCSCWPWPKTSRRNGLATLERRFLRPHHPHFQEPHLVPCPLALDQTSPSARTLKAIQESWGNLTICDWCLGFWVVFNWIIAWHTIRHCNIVLGSKCGCAAVRSRILSHLVGWNVVKSVAWPAVCLLCYSRAQSSLQAADTTSSTCWQELLQKVLTFFRLFLYSFKLVYLLIVLLGVSNLKHFLVGWLVGPPRFFPVDTWDVSNWH